jgi:hypothetical protein
VRCAASAGNPGTRLKQVLLISVEPYVVDAGVSIMAWAAAWGVAPADIVFIVPAVRCCFLLGATAGPAPLPR